MWPFPMTPQGTHHITAMCGDAQRNVDFYSHLLGLRLVKVTVNQDDPGTYHLYYGDQHGTPGSGITFFPWPESRVGRPGLGEAGVVAFTVHPGSLAFWKDRLAAHEIEATGGERFGKPYLAFADPDGIRLELVESDETRFQPATHPDIPAEHALRGFFSTTLWVADPQASEAFLTEAWGLRRIGEENGRIRLAMGEGLPHQLVDIERPEGMSHSRMGVGVVHHVAFRAQNDNEEFALRQATLDAGLQPTEQIDRFYFRSVYFREPNRILFEIATDEPGFAVDEPADALGEKLVLAPWLEAQRPAIERVLPRIKTAKGVQIP